MEGKRKKCFWKKCRGLACITRLSLSRSLSPLVCLNLCVKWGNPTCFSPILLCTFRGQSGTCQHHRNDNDREEILIFNQSVLARHLCQRNLLEFKLGNSGLIYLFLCGCRVIMLCPLQIFFSTVQLLINFKADFPILALDICRVDNWMCSVCMCLVGGGRHLCVCVCVV